MRQVFTSPRLENVEAVAELLRAQGIEVKIAEGRSYSGTRRSTFTYRIEEDASPQPSVWIVHANDQPRGRQLLRHAGLLESSRAGESSYLPLSLLDRDKDGSAAAKARRASRIRVGLLGLIAIGLGLVFFATRKPPGIPASTPAVAAPAQRIIIPQSAGELGMYRADVPTALAALLIEREIAARTPRQACIAIDGRDPAPGFIESLAAGNTQLFAKSACPGKPARDMDVHGYMTDGTGTGTVQLTLGKGKARSVEVERDGTRWRILRGR